MEILQFTLPINPPGSSAEPSTPSPSASAGVAHRFALDSRTRYTRRSSTRARTGCSNCKKRHVKCDETRPACLNCLKWRGYCRTYADDKDDNHDNHDAAGSRFSKARVARTKTAPQMLAEPAVNTIRFSSSDQRSYFDEWTALSVNFLGGFVQRTSLWTATMPQLTLEEPTLRYAAMAIGALRKAYEVEGPQMGLMSSNRHYLNAIIYYCEALSMQSKAKPNREGLRTALLSSLLFICFEAQRGNTPAALKHIAHGFSMLNELANCSDKAPDLVSIAPAPPALVQDILDCYRPLELQSRSFFIFARKPPPQSQYQQQRQMASPNTSSHSPSVHSLSSQPGTPVEALTPQSSTSYPTGLPSPQSQPGSQSQGGQLPPQAHPPRLPGIVPFTGRSPYFRPKLTAITVLDAMPQVFRTWDEMNGYWSLVQRQVIRHLPMVTITTHHLALHKTPTIAEVERKLGSVRQNPRISSFIAESRFWLQRWIEAFQPLYQSIVRNARNEPLTYLQAMSIRIEYLILYIYTALPRFSSIIAAKGMIPQYREITVLAERLHQARPKCDFSMDAGWTWPLFVASLGCRDPAVRAEAIRILGQYTIRNAIRDSRVFRAIALKNEAVEAMNAVEGSDKEQWLRLRRRDLVFEDSGTTVVFRSAQKDTATGEWVLVEEVADSNVGPDGQLVWCRRPISEQESMLAAGDDSSPASFEKALSALSKKIADTQSRLERTRTSSRKAKVLGTLYLSFAYLVYAIVLLLVVGYKNLGPYEWTGFAGGPVLIYAARELITIFSNFRIQSFEARLTEQQEERARTIQKLKDATKYDSTMELIEKYGGPEGRPKSRQSEVGDDKAGAPGGLGAPNVRTHMPPPATANIPRRDGPPPGSRPVTPLGPVPRGTSLDPTAEFAPNAFSYPPPPSPQTLSAQHHGAASAVPVAAAESHWYDRIFDVLLGEDETAAKNRIVLICRACRLVNGQAPPGTKRLAEMGTWRCMACGAPNGEMDEEKRIVRELLATAEANEKKDVKVEPPSDGEEESTEKAETADEDGPAATVKARRARGKK